MHDDDNQLFDVNRSTDQQINRSTDQQIQKALPRVHTYMHFTLRSLGIQVHHIHIRPPLACCQLFQTLILFVPIPKGPLFIARIHRISSQFHAHMHAMHVWQFVSRLCTPLAALSFMSMSIHRVRIMSHFLYMYLEFGLVFQIENVRYTIYYSCHYCYYYPACMTFVSHPL